MCQRMYPQSLARLPFPLGFCLTRCSLRALSVLDNHACKAVIRIDDVLQFFPEVTKIEMFKEKIKESLQDCEAEVEKMRQRMVDYTQDVDEIREELKELNAR